MRTTANPEMTMPRTLPHRFLVASAAALLLTATAAQAETWSSYPGAACTSDGTVIRPTNGSLLAFSVNNSGYSTFSCPIKRTFPLSNGAPTLYVYLNVKINNGSSDFLCMLRSVDSFGTIYDSDSHTFPKYYQAPNTTATSGNHMTVAAVPTENGYSAILRCQVPHYAGMPAGIISYYVRE